MRPIAWKRRAVVHAAITTSLVLAACEDEKIAPARAELECPTKEDFGRVAVQNNEVRTVACINVGDTALLITGVEVTSGRSAFSVEDPSAYVGNIAPRSVLRVPVSFRPSDVSNSAGQLEIRTDSRDSAVVTIDLLGLGQAVQTLDGGVLFIDGGIRFVDGGHRVFDGGVRYVDGGLVTIDGGVQAIDGGLHIIDGGVEAIDGGVEAIDGGVEVIDGGVESIDGGTSTLDSGADDAGCGNNRRDPGESCWIQQTSGVSTTLNDVVFPQNASQGFVVGDNGVILRTDNGGQLWNQQVSGTTANLRAVDFPVGVSVGYAVGWSGTILKTTNGGTGWTIQSSGTTFNLYGVHFPIDEMTGYVVGDGGFVAKTTNGGQNWVRQTFPGTDLLYDVHFRTALDGYIATANRRRLGSTTTGGMTWTIDQIGSDGQGLRAVHFAPGTTIGYASGWGSATTLRLSVFKTLDGTTWTPLAPVSAPGVGGLSIWGLNFPVNASIGYGVGHNVIYKTKSGGASWDLQYNQSALLFSVDFPAGDQIGYAVGRDGSGQTGLILKTTTGGE